MQKKMHSKYLHHFVRFGGSGFFVVLIRRVRHLACAGGAAVT